MKHLKVFEIQISEESLKKRAKKLTTYLKDICDVFELVNDDIIDEYIEYGEEFFLINTSGEINNNDYLKYTQILDILTKINIEWKVSLSGYIEISFSDIDKIDLFISELELIVNSNKFNI